MNESPVVFLVIRSRTVSSLVLKKWKCKENQCDLVDSDTTAVIVVERADRGKYHDNRSDLKHLFQTGSGNTAK